jgi:hypothetical protein
MTRNFDRPGPRVVAIDRIDLTRSSTLTRLTASGEIQAIMERVFSSARAEDIGTLLQGMLKKPCLQRSVHLLRNGDRRCVGFNLITVQDIPVSPTRRYAVFSSVAAVLPEYRGDNSTMAAALKEAMAFGVRHPRTPTYLFLRLVHPSSYRLFARHAPVLYERFNDETPADVRALMLACLNADALRWEERNGGFIVQESYLRVDEPAADEPRGNLDARSALFLANNPAYAQGSGLCVLMPMGPTHLLGAWRSVLLRQTGAAVRKALPARAHGALSRAAALLDRWVPVRISSSRPPDLGADP